MGVYCGNKTQSCYTLTQVVNIITTMIYIIKVVSDYFPVARYYRIFYRFFLMISIVFTAGHKESYWTYHMRYHH